MTSIADDFAAIAAQMPGDAAPATSADVELIAACASFDRLTTQYNEAHEVCGNDDDGLAAALAVIDEPHRSALDRICSIRATTNAGMQARARSLLIWLHPEPLFDGGEATCFWDERIISAIVRDLMGSAGA